MSTTVWASTTTTAATARSPHNPDWSADRVGTAVGALTTGAHYPVAFLTPAPPGVVARASGVSAYAPGVDLGEVQKNWDDLGQRDPLWAICTDNERHGNQWDPDEFFATGRTAVDAAIVDLAGLGVEVPADGRALDFGCGFGRLTLALAEHIAEVVGIDIAPSMIAGANEHNSVGPRVTYLLNEGDDLSAFDDASFDLVLSIIVLQHIENRYKAAYLREFLRVLRPGGVAYVTIPSRPNLKTPMGLGFALLPNRVLNAYRKRRFGYDGLMELHGMRREAVEALVRDAGATVVDVRPDDSVGSAWHTYRYVIGR
ncbi:MAG: hypothetical protein JWM47_3132 [Acidimicrobiales bacterium]|nr:hypothetical protein [Acidimicrobiales bacterium]